MLHVFYYHLWYQLNPLQSYVKKEIHLFYIIGINKLSPETRGKINEKFVKEFLSQFGFNFLKYTLHQKENPNPFNQRVNSPVYEFQKAPIFLSYQKVMAKIRENTGKRTEESACLRIQRFVRNKK